MAQLLCFCCCCYSRNREKNPLLPKNEDVQEMDFHLAQVSSSEGSTPWASERHSPVSEPPEDDAHEGQELIAGSIGSIPEGESDTSKKSWKLYPSPGPSKEGTPPPLTVQLRTQSSAFSS